MKEGVQTAGVIDARHFLIAIVAIVAIVALAFTVVYASGGFRGTAFQATEGHAFQVYTQGNNIAVMDWACFEDCLNTALGINTCKEVCEINPSVVG